LILIYLIIYRNLNIKHYLFRRKHPQTSLAGIIKIFYDKIVNKIKNVLQ